MSTILKKTVSQQDLYRYFVSTVGGGGSLGTNGVVTFGAPALQTTRQLTLIHK